MSSILVVLDTIADTKLFQTLQNQKHEHGLFLIAGVPWEESSSYQKKEKITMGTAKPPAEIECSQIDVELSEPGICKS